MPVTESEIVITAEQGQTLDASNTKVVTSADASPGSPWIGAWTQTRDLAYVRILTVLAGSVANIGGTFTFEFSENGSTATISEARIIGDFDTVRDFDLLNAGAYYRVKFEPAVALGANSVFITTTLRMQDDGAFVRLANQQIEEANAALPSEFAYIKAFDSVTGKSVNIRPTKLGALRVRDDVQTVTQSGALFVEGIRDDIDLQFSRDKGVQTIASYLVDCGSVNGTVTHDATEGQAVIAVPATAGSIAFYCSDKTVVYEPGHMIRGGQTIQISTQPTGTGKVEWGFGEHDGASDLDNAIGWGYDATGLYTFRRKNGVDVTKTYQTDFNRDKLDGSTSSRYQFNDSPVAIDMSKNGIFEQQFEWYGIASPTYLVAVPLGRPIEVNVEETVGQQLGTTVPEPNIPMFIRIENDAVTPQAIQVRTGSWRGGIFTNSVAQLGRQPDRDYVTSKADGTVLTDTTVFTANQTRTFTSAVTTAAGWFDSDGWATVEIVIATDQVSSSDGIVIEYTDDVDVVTPVARTSESFSFTASDIARGYLKVIRSISLDGFRVKYTNGGTLQGSFFCQVNVKTTPAGAPIANLESQINSTNLAQMGRNAVFAKNPSNVYGLVGRGANGGLDVNVTEHTAETPLKALSTFEVNQANVTTTAALIIAPTANRRSLSIRALIANGQKVYIGPDAGVTTGSGYELAAGAAIDIDLDETESVYMISNSGTQRVCWLEAIKA